MGTCTKIAAITPRVRLADIRSNTTEIISLLRQAAEGGASIAVFPAHAISGATCGDIAGHQLFQEAMAKARKEIAEAAESLGIRAVLEPCTLDGIIFEPAAEPETVLSHRWRKAMLSSRSIEQDCAIVWCGAGWGESTCDAVYSGAALAYNRGRLVAENERFSREPSILFADIESDAEACAPEACPPQLSPMDPHPFVPSDPAELELRCSEILSIQAAGLAARIECIHAKTAVIGISGGLDSTLAILVAAKAFDSLGMDRKDIIAVTMPGFGTTDRTHDNARDLMEGLGVSIREISIVPAIEQHFKDIDHDPSMHNSAYENAQARERTQILMDIANDHDGLVVGTGDLSEIALGWCTYNGDHMCMYGVNGGVPKTLMQAMVTWAANNVFPEVKATLIDIVGTPISPELIPADENGNMKQKTEDLVGPYELHDFFLFYFVRHGCAPSQILNIACAAFGDIYDRGTIKKWLGVFLRRFFTQQFKRNCSPEGPRVGSVSLSPRGGWAMPSDSSAALWLADLENA